jgi:hypothetical protein
MGARRGKAGFERLDPDRVHRRHGAVGMQQCRQPALLLRDQVDRLQGANVMRDDGRVQTQCRAQFLDFGRQLGQHIGHRGQWAAIRAGSGVVDSSFMLPRQIRAIGQSGQIEHHDHAVLDSGQPFKEGDDAVIGGGRRGCSVSLLMVTMSLTESTIRPHTCAPSCVTMMAWRGVGSVASQPSRAARSITGNTLPRRLTTPAT